MARSFGNSPSNGFGLRWAAGLILATALAAGWWLTQRSGDDKATPAREDAAAVPGKVSPSLRDDSGKDRGVRAGGKDFPKPTADELTELHELKPDDAEWDQLLRLLQQKLPDPPSEEDREIAEAVMARFAAHAGARQVDDLASVYRNASSMEVGQRALEVLGTLQSEEFQERAREIVADRTLPADDQVVTALARSLVESGEPGDLVMVLDRIDSGKTNGLTEYNGLDGLMAAVTQAMAPEMEEALCEALANQGRTWTARLAAAAALQHHATSRSTRVLGEAAKNDGDERVRKEAAESLRVLRKVDE